MRVMSKRHGFTLIELLSCDRDHCVYSRPGYFQSLRESVSSARRIQCLSNVKNIAMAVQIYLTDYDRLWPHEDRQDYPGGVRAAYRLQRVVVLGPPGPHEPLSCRACDPGRIHQEPGCLALPKRPSRISDTGSSIHGAETGGR